ncbi:MAG: tRNA (adenosine(37)-N6)-threonylcarbamoyltransferase complex dimerization subunit type 1 TsaB [Oscillospiraceae bacterium]|nr:tRNA (adenosine(37)-N6)-threonylcarbamoyltransferase complex dimerization subunit type 1 TsaB [Oscillospiraceae bacterium]
MVILALESSATPVSAAVYDGEKQLSFEFENNGLTHSATLLPMADRVLSAAGKTMDDIDAVAVAIGPGSFTGLRIGASTAKGLAWGKDKPCIGVSTLAAMARQASCVDGILVPVMDARRGQFYNALFRSSGGELKRLTEDRAVAYDQLISELGKYEDENIIIMGDGTAKFMELTGGAAGTPADEKYRWQSAAGVALEAINAETVPADKLVPNYIRLSQAERERLERENNK